MKKPDVYMRGESVEVNSISMLEQIRGACRILNSVYDQAEFLLKYVEVNKQTLSSSQGYGTGKAMTSALAHVDGDFIRKMENLPEILEKIKSIADKWASVAESKGRR